MEAEQTAWLSSNNVPTTNSDAKYTWHVAPETKVRLFVLLYDVLILVLVVNLNVCLFGAVIGHLF